MLRSIRHRLRSAPLDLCLWDGTGFRSLDEPTRATLTIADRPTLLRLAWYPDLEFGKAYASGTLEIEGDLVDTLEAIYRALDASATPSTRQRAWGDRGAATSERAARQNIHHHYDLGNDFYALWLDDQLVYTSAYFTTVDRSLEQAQLAKMDLVCRKVRLRPGDRVVEAGCGWGALALHMAKHYGARVTAYNISREQIAYARDRAAREGLADRVEFIEGDYRAIRGTFDCFMAVGMLEHVGSSHYATLGRLIDRCLDRTHGRGLLHFIGRNWPQPLNAWIRHRIFPGAYPPTLAQVCQDVLQPWDLSVTDVENLRLHYAKTLAHWLERFERSAQVVTAMFDETFTRAWRLYLAGSQAAFRAGSMQLFQIVFSRGTSNDVAWTRAYLHESEPRDEARSPFRWPSESGRRADAGS